MASVSASVSEPESELIAWVAAHAKSAHRWAMVYLILHNWLTMLSLAIAIAVPFGLAVMYASETPARRWNAVLLAMSGVGLVAQVLNSIMRFKERAVQGRNMAKALETASLKYRSGNLDQAQFFAAIDRFVERATDEPLP